VPEAITVEPDIWKHGIWIGSTILVKKLPLTSNILTLLAAMKLLALLWKLETVFPFIFVFPDNRLRCRFLARATNF
jgi:hypothetical protein